MATLAMGKGEVGRKLLHSRIVVFAPRASGSGPLLVMIFSLHRIQESFSTRISTGMYPELAEALSEAID